MDGQTLNGYVLIFGSLGMMLVVIALILFIYLYQKKLIRKERAFREIENILKKQELKSAYTLIEGQDQERKRIATDIHDNIGSLLATLKIYSDLALRATEPAETHRLSEKVNGIAETLADEIRKISHSLDSGTLGNFGLSAAIEQLCEAVRNSGKIQVTSFVDLQDIPESAAALDIYRIVQELFTNTLRHSRATAVRLEITQVNGEISIIHQDNGIGFDPQASPGMGLRNIRSRVNRLMGELRIQSSPAGSTFIIDLPPQHAS